MGKAEIPYWLKEARIWWNIIEKERNKENYYIKERNVKWYFRSSFQHYKRTTTSSNTTSHLLVLMSLLNPADERTSQMWSLVIYLAHLTKCYNHRLGWQITLMKRGTGWRIWSENSSKFILLFILTAFFFFFYVDYLFTRKKLLKKEGFGWEL